MVNGGGAKSRRAHKKAKTGCLDCRRRRVKCSEEKPECRACCRRGVECQYPSFQARSLSAGHSPATQHGDETSPDSTRTLTQRLNQGQHISPIPILASLSCPAILRQSREQSSATFGIEDMALLHHWTVSTSLDVYKNSGVSITCQVTFPQIAFKHPFVMQALLGLTALHVAYLDPQERLKYTADAARYHNQGLQGFNEAIHMANDELADALFVWFSLNLLYVFGVSGRLGEGFWVESGWGSRKDRILGTGWIPMVRGILAILSPSFSTLRAGPLRELLSVGNFDDMDPDKIMNPDDQRFCQTRHVWKNNPDAPIYEKTLWFLRQCRMFMAQFSTMDVEDHSEAEFNRAWQGAFLFVPFVPEEYFSLLH
ncbi:hypothetical protein FOQG_18052 [Fusarium oxysporum f. sp. raphani 54005]|uniref:Zn(2)-C6 fungal-type domain-containing protein n=4 Tax=Fusarium oxysporum TaxID=5507 RepID=X0B556_FUSOX|nr:hypothetical protein FOXB_00960 [Fusarium oxysporum f. sp. conglutinans Fo5176]EXK77230.1 hypothetical protein FOQG_18052 [Fusarium oxysporum f. sp. raphani 54005]KAG6980051.1 Sterol uptake control protein 2 [Fusarium oxysporum f. sp. conglutinans]KAG7406812.1 Sterol uptake control protein 2 [Fusarium oxysporum f. sp. raphani]KAI8401798.1 hypothetical protein FOFC_18667 [Fusarium oxysporum]